MTLATQAYILLEDGTRFDGDAVGAPGHVTGEVVFTTGMAGYQESVTDPSFRRQIVVFTYPHIGNYGVSDDAMESDAIHARGVVMRAGVNHTDTPSAQLGWLDWLTREGVPAISGVDTRALVRHLRDRGAMRGGIFPATMAPAQAMEHVQAEAPMEGLDLAREVTPTEVVLLGGDNDGPRIAVIDTGIKRSIVRRLVDHGARVELHPCTTSAAELVARDADAYFLANGPGDPAALDHVVDVLRQLIGTKPTFGICMGHQLLARAVGLETFKLRFGHRGANHPVKDLQTGVVEITSQNHGFAIVGPGGQRRLEGDEPVRWETDFGTAQLSHINLYDRTVEGMTLLDVAGGTVQYHPEAGPGPHDSLYLFDRFLAQIGCGDAPRADSTRASAARGGDA